MALPRMVENVGFIEKGRGDGRAVVYLKLPVQAEIRSVNGVRFVHDTLELHGWDVETADAQKAKGLALLTVKTATIDAWVLAELSGRDLGPSIGLYTFGVRAERERARFRLHLVRHGVTPPNPMHATMLSFQGRCGLGALWSRGPRGSIAWTSLIPGARTYEPRLS